MARTTHESAKEFENQNTFEFFTLVDDGDTAKVQFMVDNIADVLTYTTHEIPMLSRSGKEFQRKVSCHKTHKSDPEGVCPFCDAGMKVKIARFIPMYDIENKKVVLWDRGSRFIDSQLAGFFNRMRSQGVDVKQLVVEIVRQGKKGDNQTTYALYPMERMEPQDTSNLEIPDPEGSLIAVWSPAEMKEYNATGTIPQAHDTTNNGVQRRGSTPATAPVEQTATDNTPIDFSDSVEVSPVDFF